MSSVTWLWARGVPNNSQGYGTSLPLRGESATPDENGAVSKEKSPEVKLKWHHIILVSGQCNSARFTSETPTPSAPFLWQAFCKTALNFPQINSYFSYHKYNCHFIYCIHIPFKYIKVSDKTTRTKTSGLLFIQYWWGNLNQSWLDLWIVDVNCFEKNKKKVISCWYNPCYNYI